MHRGGLAARTTRVRLPRFVGMAAPRSPRCVSAQEPLCNPERVLDGHTWDQVTRYPLHVEDDNVLINLTDGMHLLHHDGAGTPT